MTQAEQINKFKNTAINITIIIVALIVTYNIYKSNLTANELLKARISEEEKKSVELEKISKLNKKAAAYKKLLSGKDSGVVMDGVVGMARSAGVKILSVKPSQEESASDYIKSFFDVSVKAPEYENLGKFINMLEASENVYMVEGINIDKEIGQEDTGLTVNLRISLVAAKLQ